MIPLSSTQIIDIVISKNQPQCTRFSCVAATTSFINRVPTMRWSIMQSMSFSDCSSVRTAASTSTMPTMSGQSEENCSSHDLKRWRFNSILRDSSLRTYNAHPGHTQHISKQNICVTFCDRIFKSTHFQHSHTTARAHVRASIKRSVLHTLVHAIPTALVATGFNNRSTNS